MWDQHAATSDISSFANAAATISLAAQNQVWTQTQAALRIHTDVKSRVEIRDLVPVPMPESGCRDVSPYEAYRWPLARAFRLVREGRKPDEALRQGRNVLRQLADTDVQLAHTNAAIIYYNLDPRIKGYRRVIAGTCDFCAAHTHEYFAQQVMPLHPGCKCSSEPVLSREPGRRVDANNWRNALVVRVKSTSEELAVARPRQQLPAWLNKVLLGALTFHEVSDTLTSDTPASGTPEDTVPE